LAKVVLSSTAYFLTEHSSANKATESYKPVYKSLLAFKLYEDDFVKLSISFPV